MGFLTSLFTKGGEGLQTELYTRRRCASCICGVYYESGNYNKFSREINRQLIKSVFDIIRHGSGTANQHLFGVRVVYGIWPISYGRSIIRGCDRTVIEVQVFKSGVNELCDGQKCKKYDAFYAYVIGIFYHQQVRKVSCDDVVVDGFIVILKSYVYGVLEQ